MRPNKVNRPVLGNPIGPCPSCQTPDSNNVIYVDERDSQIRRDARVDMARLNFPASAELEMPRRLAMSRHCHSLNGVPRFAVPGTSTATSAIALGDLAPEGNFFDIADIGRAHLKDQSCGSRGLAIDKLRFARAAHMAPKPEPAPEPTPTAPAATAPLNQRPVTAPQRIGLKRTRLGLAPSSPSRFFLSASYSW